MEKQLKFIFVCSTAGSVMNEVLKANTVRNVTHSVVADRNCGALDRAAERNITSTLIEETNCDNFCRLLLDYVRANDIDYVISFYTQFYSDEFRAAMSDRIINFHPSLLPAFKGMDGFGDGLAYHTKLIGTTVELIKDAMDEGKIVMQTVCPVDPFLDKREVRHRIFNQQCKTLIQVVDWLTANRISVEGDKVTVANATYDDIEFSPSLENSEAVAFSVPFPHSVHELEKSDI